MKKLLHDTWSNSAFRYLLAGGAAFLVDAGLLALFLYVFGWPVWLSAAVSFVLSFAFTYTAQRLFTFKTTLPHGKALIRYVLLVAFNTVATSLIVTLLSGTPLTWAGGKVVATLASTFWNYFVYRYWIFPAEDVSHSGLEGRDSPQQIDKDSEEQ